MGQGEVHDDSLNVWAEGFYDSAVAEEGKGNRRGSAPEAATVLYGVLDAYMQPSSAGVQRNGGWKDAHTQGPCVVCHNHVGSTSVVAARSGE